MSMPGLMGICLSPRVTVPCPLRIYTCGRHPRPMHLDFFLDGDSPHRVVGGLHELLQGEPGPLVPFLHLLLHINDLALSRSHRPSGETQSHPHRHHHPRHT